MGLFEALVSIFTSSSKKTHTFTGKGGTYWKKGSASSGRKGKTIAFKKE